jgi:DNA-binding IclR family transcriptional regulator
MDQSCVHATVNTESPPQRHPTLGAVDKALILFDRLITEGGPLTLATLTRMTGLSKPTVHRLLGILREHDMISAGTQGYQPAERFIRPVAPATGKLISALRRTSIPYLTELHLTTGATASVGILLDGNTAYVNRVHNHNAIRTPSFRTNYAPVWPTAIGRILLANTTVAHPEQHAAQLNEIRRLGIAYLVDEYVPGVTCIAALVSSGNETRPPIAVALSGPTGVVSLDFAPLVRRVAYALSRAYPPLPSLSSL